jgi:hypothetical protein
MTVWILLFAIQLPNNDWIEVKNKDFYKTEVACLERGEILRKESHFKTVLYKCIPWKK